MSIQLKDASGSNQTINTLPPTGQATGANSLPFVLASDHGAVPISAPPSLPLPAGAASETNLTAVGNALHADLQALHTDNAALAGAVATEASLAGVKAAAGTPADAAWSGTGNSTIVSALKALFGLGGSAGTSPPALATNASGQLGWFRKIVDTLTSGFSSAAADAHLTNVQSAPGTAQTTAVTVQGNASGVAVPTALSAGDAGVAVLAAALAAGALTPPIQMRAQSQVVTDLVSTTFSAGTTMGAAIALDSGNTYGAEVNVTAVAGTNPTFDVILMESKDGGATYKEIYHVYRITAVGKYPIPVQLLTGMRQFKFVVGGSATPTFTATITGTRGTGAAPIIRNFYDYATIQPNTTNSKSPLWNVAGCKSLQLTAFNGGTSTTSAIFQAVMSQDGVNMATAGSTIQPGQNTVMSTTFSTQAQFAGVNVQTAGVAETINYVNIYGVG